MYRLCIVVFLIQGAFSITPCRDGVRIESQVTNKPEDLIGNWSYIYHWDTRVKFAKEFLGEKDKMYECPELHFEEITPELIKAKEAECAKDKVPFNWADAKLRVDAPVLKMKEGVIIYGEKENWMVVDCLTYVRVVVHKVSDEYRAMTNPDRPGESELIVRDTPTLDELKCVAHNVDVGNGRSGFGLCYKK